MVHDSTLFDVAHLAGIEPSTFEWHRESLYRLKSSFDSILYSWGLKIM